MPRRGRVATDRRRNMYISTPGAVGFGHSGHAHTGIVVHLVDFVQYVFLYLTLK